MTEQVEERLLEKVRKLYERAYHPNTPPVEAETARQMADRFVMKYAIDQALLDAKRLGTKRLPVTRKFEAFGSVEWREKFVTVLADLASTYRCRSAVHHGSEYRMVTVVGMPDDVDIYEMVWTNIYMQFVSKINPTWDDNLSFDHNIYNFKIAGFKWPEIYRVATEHHHHLDGPQDGAMIRAYKRHAKMVGDTHQIKTQRHAAYRESFAESFVRTVCRRLEQQREDNDKAAVAGGAQLVLRDVSDDVDEAFYSLFEHLRPMSEEERDRLLEEYRLKRERKQQELEERLAKMTPLQRERYEHKQEEERRKQAKRDNQYWRQLERDNDRKYDPAGYTAGKRAGESVDLSGNISRIGGRKAGELE